MILFFLLFLSKDAIQSSLHVCTLYCVPGTCECVQDKPSKLTQRESFEFERLFTLFSQLTVSRVVGLLLSCLCGQSVSTILALLLLFIRPFRPYFSLVSSSFVPQWYYTVLVARRDYHPGTQIPRLRSPFII